MSRRHCDWIALSEYWLNLEYDTHQIQSICFPFGWQIHFALSFLPLLAFQPFLAKHESSLSWCMVSHICWWYNSVFLFIFQCGVVPCLSIVLAWDGFPLCRDSLAPSWCCALFCRTFLVHMFCGCCTRWMCHFMLCECWILLWLLQNLSEKDYGLLNNELCWFDTRFVDDLGFIDPYLLSSVHFGWGNIITPPVTRSVRAVYCFWVGLFICLFVCLFVC